MYAPLVLSQPTWQRLNGGRVSKASTTGVSVGGGAQPPGQIKYVICDADRCNNNNKKALISVLLSVNSLIQELISNLRLRSRRRRNKTLANMMAMF